ncbi:formate dehydrogenase accessory sulfurtransferase FdhD [Methanoculleus sp. Wushi-C6]|uniref:Sulfur carrier protein FdhD n=1 Tax=Methanoculleus caldifontis TaxID=2651577 RepID=A0ABU3X285_9EURY|nr:formate dehydrogenase accessory sulfurtransferase FdhD [Methanoculleus sp. Wushi-C6]MDV2482170.1 formate dehydrogenase accessory sulfurtransferase FdhD [Methanoculleus sp. Wushi-C6]
MLYRELPIVKGDGETFVPATHPVVEEMPLSVTVNGRHALTAMTSPAMLREFVVGFLYTERIVKELREIESIRIEGNTASVLTKNPFAILTSHKTVLSGCGGSTSFLDTGRLPAIRSDLVLAPEAIRAATKETLDSDLHRITGGIHLVGLFEGEGKAIRIAEDIGRHNALDRVVGHGLLEGIDFSRTFAVSSGRISSEMVRKCLVANIPVIVSRGATTTTAVEAAEAGGLTVIGFVRSKKMNVYTGWGRVRGASPPSAGE